MAAMAAVRRVCVVGAGAAGLTVARHLQPAFDVTVFELGTQPGGTWVFEVSVFFKKNIK